MKHTKLNILIADDSIPFTNLLVDFLSNQLDFQVQGVAHNGTETLQYYVLL